MPPIEGTNSIAAGSLRPRICASWPAPDGMLTVTDARAVRAHIAARGKPLRGLVVTHAHPDHYAGAHEILRGHDVPYLATAAVATAIARDDATKDRIVGPMILERQGVRSKRPRVAPGELAGIVRNVATESNRRHHGRGVVHGWRDRVADVRMYGRIVEPDGDALPEDVIEGG